MLVRNLRQKLHMDRGTLRRFPQLFFQTFLLFFFFNFSQACIAFSSRGSRNRIRFRDPAWSSRDGLHFRGRSRFDSHPFDDAKNVNQFARTIRHVSPIVPEWWTFGARAIASVSRECVRANRITKSHLRSGDLEQRWFNYRDRRITNSLYRICYKNCVTFTFWNIPVSRRSVPRKGLCKSRDNRRI